MERERRGGGEREREGEMGREGGMRDRLMGRERWRGKGG